MRSMRRLLLAIGVVALLAIVLGSAALGSGWTSPARVTPIKGSGLSSLHELASSSTALHLVHGRIGPGVQDDRLVYQRSTNGGASWSRERPIFSSTRADRSLVLNFAVAASDDVVIVAWRARGPGGTALYIRRSIDGGTTWRPPLRLAKTPLARGLGVPALAVTGDTAIAAWTDRDTGDIVVRRSTNRGGVWGDPRVLGRSQLSIVCADDPVVDGLVGLGATGRTVHLAWSEGPQGSCISNALRVRTSFDGGRTWGPARRASTQRTYGWPEVVARGKRMLMSLQRPDGAFVIVRSTDAGRTFTERVFLPSGDKALGAPDILMPGGSRAWLVYTDITYRGDDVATSRLRYRQSTNSGASWGVASDVVGTAPRLRQATNIAARGSRPVVVYQSGRVDGSTSDIMVVRAR
jgi:hypothetical protein